MSSDTFEWGFIWILVMTVFENNFKNVGIILIISNSDIKEILMFIFIFKFDGIFNCRILTV